MQLTFTIHISFFHFIHLQFFLTEKESFVVKISFPVTSVPAVDQRIPPFLFIQFPKISRQIKGSISCTLFSLLSDEFYLIVQVPFTFIVLQSVQSLFQHLRLGLRPTLVVVKGNDRQIGCLPIHACVGSNPRNWCFLTLNFEFLTVYQLYCFVLPSCNKIYIKWHVRNDHGFVLQSHDEVKVIVDNRDKKIYKILWVYATSWWMNEWL